MSLNFNLKVDIIRSSPILLKSSYYHALSSGSGVSKRENSEREVPNWQRGRIWYSLLVSSLEISLQGVNTWNLILTFCWPMCVYQCR
jgi:hypothetical protein